MIAALEAMHPGQAGALRDYFNKYDFYVRLLLAPPEEFLIPPYALAHDSLVEPSLVGNKSHHLLLLKHAAKAHIPDGFTIAAPTFGLLVAHNRLRPALDLLLSGISRCVLFVIPTSYIVSYPERIIIWCLVFCLHFVH